MKAPEIFRNAVSHIMGERGVKQSELADATGIARPHMNSYLKGNRGFSEDKREKIASHFGMTYMEMLDVGRGIFEERQSDQPPTDITTERHRKLLDRFRQKDLALEINQLLVEIEDIDMETLRDAVPVLNLLKIQAEKKAAKKRPAANGEE